MCLWIRLIWQHPLPPASSFRKPFLGCGLEESTSDKLEHVDFIVPVRKQRWVETLPSCMVGTHVVPKALADTEESHHHLRIWQSSGMPWRQGVLAQCFAAHSLAN